MPTSRGEGKVTIVLADDHTIMRNGLRMLLDTETDFDVVGEAGTIQEVFQEVRAHRPRVVVLDLNMPGGSSIDAIGRIARFAPGTSIVVLTMEHEVGFMRDAYEAGAHGYVLKEAAPTQLARAIRQATAS